MISNEVKEEKVLIDGLKINYKIAGEGKPLLILHGWAGSSNSWTEVQKNLAGNDLKIICPDLPGFGKSQNPPFGWGVKEYSDFALKFIGKLGFQKISLMGHSFGGRIAIKFATYYPEKLENLILCSSAGIRHNLSFHQRIIVSLARFGNYLFSRKPLIRYQDTIRNIFYMILRQRDYLKVKGTMREAFHKIVIEDLEPDLPKIKARTLIIWGEIDKTVPLKDAFVFKEKISRSTLETIPKTSHTPNLEAPEKVAEIVSHFLRA